MEEPTTYTQLEMPGLIMSETKAKRLESLRSRISQQKQKMDDARAGLGATYAGVEDEGINKAALKLAMKVDAMDPAKAKDFVSSLNTYLHEFGVIEKIANFNEAEAGTGVAARTNDDGTPKRRGGRAKANGNGQAAHA